jgi:LmbE family N-acetylglucosaminyl deacetylase
LLLSVFSQAQDAAASRQTDLRELLRKLHTTARLLQTTAHPDDEDGGMLTLESRGKGASVMLLTLTRGEGGQNRMGSNLLDELGVLRTLELLAADRYYGVEQRFTRVADFGFSKNPEEAFQKWHGHEAALEDMVRVIRTFRPDVVASRYQGTAQDGHGQHSAAGILTREAFHAAADPQRFPEQIEAGLQPWQARKLYIGNVHPPEDFTLVLDTAAADPLLGTSYLQYAWQGLRHQLSQGAGAWQISPERHLSYYRLVESELSGRTPGTETQRHRGQPEISEQDFFDGIDTSLPGLASRLGEEEAAVPFLRPALLKLQAAIQQATDAVETGSAEAGTPLLAGLRLNDKLIGKIEHSRFSPESKADLLVNLRTKQEQLQQAANLALGVTLRAMVEAGPAASPEQAFVAVPGESFTLLATFSNGGTQAITLPYIGLNLPPGWRAQRMPESSTGSVEAPGTVRAGGEIGVRFRVQVPANAEITRPYWRRANPESDTIYTLDQPQFATLPFPPPAVRVHAEYKLKGEPGRITANPEVAYRDADGELHEMPLSVEPAFSVELHPATQIVPLSAKDGFVVHTTIRKNLSSAANPEVRLELPAGWQAEPRSAQLRMTAESRQATVDFHVAPGALQAGPAQINTVVDYGGSAYKAGYTVVSRPDLGAFFYSQPASQRVSVVDVTVLSGLKVGYVAGAGDEIASVLRQTGINVATISPQELATGDLQRFDTIVVGIRAYDTRQEVRPYNSRLLDYVAAGGTLVVQYNSGMEAFNAGNFTPYPAKLGHGRVSLEQAPVEILDPQQPIFQFPNRITPADFAGWVQERGLYFMSEWDPHFEPLLAAHDPGEPPLKGGLLYARYGKGVYVYTGYSFFRQLPAGVPGAIRLFVNLVSAGHEK